METKDSTKTLSNAIASLAAQKNELAKQAIEIYTPAANSISNGEIISQNKAEFILDYMLDFCFDAEMLALFKNILRNVYLRYLDGIYPFSEWNVVDMVESYANRYRDLFDNNEEPADA